MQKLIPCTKPADLDEEYVGETVRIQTHIIQGRWGKDGTYYQHDKTTDTWYRLVTVTKNQAEKGE